MPATYVTEQELRDNLGIQDLYPDSVVEECCQTAQDLLNQFLWFDSAPVVGTNLQNNIATVMIANPFIFTTGQSITLSGCGSTFNGTTQLPVRSHGAPGQQLKSLALYGTRTHGIGRLAIALCNMRVQLQTRILSVYYLTAKLLDRTQKLQLTPLHRP